MNQNNFQMNFKIKSIDDKEFSSLFNLDDLALEKMGAVRMIVDECPGFPCRVSLEEARIKTGMTHEELAAKCGTNKSYISRIEHDASDIKLSTLIKIIRLGLGGELKLVMP